MIYHHASKIGSKKKDVVVRWQVVFNVLKEEKNASKQKRVIELQNCELNHWTIPYGPLAIVEEGVTVPGHIAERLKKAHEALEFSLLLWAVQKCPMVRKICTA
jgi:hypothetical protein